MVYRVIQIGAGTVGKESIRSILGRDDMELVGLFVYSPEKAAIDAGTIVGANPIGVVATNDFEAILNLDADCAVYCGLGAKFGSHETVRHICALLESGKNVTTVALSVPWILDDEVRHHVDTACERGGASYHSTGLNPGFLFDFWPTALTRVMRRVDCIKLTEVDDLGSYGSDVLNDVMGFGRKPDEDIPIIYRGGDPNDSFLLTSFRPCFHLLGLAHGFAIARYKLASDVALASEPIQMPGRVVEPGTVAAVRFKIDAFDGDDRRRASYEAVWFTSPNVLPASWPHGKGKYSWRVRIDGDPSLESTFSFEDVTDGSRADIVMTAAPAVNAIPSIVAATPGIHTFLDLPTFGGRVGAN